MDGRQLTSYLGERRQRRLIRPAFRGSPRITGTAQSGQVITSSQGFWDRAVSFAYQWKRAGVDIGGATSSTFTLGTPDVGQLITCQVTATNPNGSTVATTAAVTPS